VPGELRIENCLFLDCSIHISNSTWSGQAAKTVLIEQLLMKQVGGGEEFVISVRIGVHLCCWCALLLFFDSEISFVIHSSLIISCSSFQLQKFATDRHPELKC